MRKRDVRDKFVLNEMYSLKLDILSLLIGGRFTKDELLVRVLKILRILKLWRMIKMFDFI